MECVCVGWFGLGSLVQVDFEVGLIFVKIKHDGPEGYHEEAGGEDDDVLEGGGTDFSMGGRSMGGGGCVGYLGHFDSNG